MIQDNEMIFNSFFLGGFECSTHCLANGRRLDIVASSRHDEFVNEDYKRLVSQNIKTCREGLRWHLIEPGPHIYNFASVLPFLEAGQKYDIQIIWDLFHYGWPADIAIFSTEFIDRFQAFAHAFTKYYCDHTDRPLFVAPINEISFISWAAGDVGWLNPFEVNNGNELKRHLVRASLAATDAIWNIDPRARIVQIDPVIHITQNPLRPESDVEGYNNAQYAAWDMLGGAIEPNLGGHPKYLDIIGINFYPKNQWIDHGEPIKFTDPGYKHFRTIIAEVADRFKRPLFIAETGTEDDERAEWFEYICNEVWAALESGVKIEGICLYPILNHPGWEDDRHCHNGLWDYADDDGNRQIYRPLEKVLKEFQKQTYMFE